MNIWMDKSGNNYNGYLKENNAANIVVIPTVLQNNTDSTQTWWINGKSVIYGTTGTGITFDGEINPQNYTVINLCHYGYVRKNKILRSTIDDVLFGYSPGYGDDGPYDGNAGVGYNGYDYITTDEDKFDRNWLFSTQQHDYYRGNFMDYTLDTLPNSVNTMLQYGNKLGINVANDGSTFGCAEIIVSNDKLDLDELLCIENYLQRKYNHIAPTPS